MFHLVARDHLRSFRFVTRGAAVALAALVAMAATGCGGDDHPSAASTNATAASVVSSPPTSAAPTSPPTSATPPTSAPATSVAATVPPPAALTEQLQALTAAGVPGVVVRGRHGTTTVEAAAGVADRDQGTPMTTETHFRTGSVAKTFVATVVLQLADEGVLSLDDTVEHWLPGLVPNGGDITVRHLLGNRSGLFDFAADPRLLQPYLEGDAGHVWEPRQLVAIANEHAPNFAPGAGTLYSNTDYTVLGLVAEAATGIPMAEQIRTRLIEPLHLEATAVPADGALEPPFARGYFVTDRLLDATNVDPSASSFGGNLVSTADDLAVFFDALFGGRLVPPALLAEMEQATVSSTGERLGLGLQVVDLPCGTFIGHSGSTPGYKAAAFNDLTGDRQFVILVNSLTLDDRVGGPEAAQAFDQALNLAACG